VLSGLAIGILFPDTFSPVRAWAGILMATITFCNSLSGSFRKIGHVLLHPLPAFVILLLLHVVMPVLGLLMGRIFLPENPLFMTGIVLQLSIPSAITTLMWVGTFGGNIHLSLALILLDTLLAPAIVPLVLRVLIGSVVQLDMLSMTVELIWMVAIPATIAMLLNQTTHGWAEKTLKPRLSLFSKAALFVLVLANATGCGPFLRDLNGTLVLVIVLIFSLCLTGFLMGYLCARLLKLDFPSASTVTINSGMRNNSIGIVLASEFFPPDVLFPVSLAPLFSQLTTSIVVRLLARTKAAKEASGDES
jgi:predicted Na+-dependent transporter